MNKTQKYESAIKQLEEIAAQIESGKLDVDELADKLKEAKSLIGACKEILTKVENDVSQVLENNRDGEKEN